MKHAIMPLAFAGALLATAAAAQAPDLSVWNQPARAPCMPRPPDLTYGGLPHMPGFERDHLRPLGLGGADTPDNVKYQQLPLAKQKNADEHHAEMMVCDEHLWSLDYAIGWLAGRWPVDIAHGYLMQSVPGETK